MRSFADICGDLGRGQTFEHVTEQLAGLALAVQETQQPGELTLILKLQANGTKTIIINDVVKVKTPSPLRGSSVFYVGSDGSLLRDDPKQKQFPFDATASDGEKDDRGAI